MHEFLDRIMVQSVFITFKVFLQVFFTETNEEANFEK